MSRIALFFSSLRVGGVERVMLNLARGLLARGIEVDLVPVQARGPLLPYVPSEARLIDLAAKRTLLALRPLVKYLKTERPMALLSAQTHNNVLAIWARRLTGIPLRLVVSEHINIQEVATRTKGRERLRPLAARLFYPQADAIVAVSWGVAQALRRVMRPPTNKISVIYNPAVTPELMALAQQPLHHPWFAAGEPPVVLAVGRLAPLKDYPTLLRAFARMRARRPARLLILGEGEQRKALECLTTQLGIAEHVAMPGFDPNPYRFMARCQVFVLSSAWEGFSVVTAEALACGAQVVATDCPSGPAEILENGKYGRLVPRGDDIALAAAIEEALDHPLPPEMLKARAACFSVAAITDQYIKVLLEEG